MSKARSKEGATHWEERTRITSNTSIAIAKMEEVLEEEPSILEQGSTMDQRQLLKTEEEELMNYPMPSELRILNEQAVYSNQMSDSRRESQSIGPVPSGQLLSMRSLAYTNHPLYKPSF